MFSLPELANILIMQMRAAHNPNAITTVEANAANNAIAVVEAIATRIDEAAFKSCRIKERGDFRLMCGLNRN